MDREQEGKICVRCGVWHPLDDYYTYISTYNGQLYHLIRCKECTKIHREELKMNIRKPKKVLKRDKSAKQKAKNIAEVQMEAQKNGMSYGKWVALQYQNKEKQK